MKYLYLLVVLGVLVVFPKKVSADGLSLGVYPPLVQIEANPGVLVKTPIIIQNLGDNTVNLQISLKPFTTSSKENGEIEYPTDSISKELEAIFKKIQILDKDEPIENITLSPKQRKTINLKIDLAKDDITSDYYFSIIFISNPELSSGIKNNLTTTSAGIASNIILSVGKKDKPKGIIEEFFASSFLEKGPVVFKVRVKNTGSSVITPKGIILIKNMFNQTVGKVDLLPVNILAQTTRKIPDSSTLNFSEAIWPESFLLGAYTATLNISLSEEGPVFSRTIRFFGFPTQLAVGVFIAIAIVLTIRNRIKSRLS